MRGRKPMPDGRRNTFSAKLSDAEAATVNAAIQASEMKPAVWVRQALLDSAAGTRRIGPLDGQMPGTVHFGIIGVTDFAPDEPAPKPRSCKHPNLRTKGVCPDCQTWVASK